MKVTVYYIGRKSKNFYEDAEKDFIKRLRHYSRFDIIRIDPPKKSSGMDALSLKREEAKLFEKQFNQDTAIVLLDEKGKSYNSRAFAKVLETWQMSKPQVAFCIGGALGFDEGLKSKADALLSLSPLTLPHHLARIVFLEQLYRAFTIRNNEPYHND